MRRWIGPANCSSFDPPDMVSFLELILLVCAREAGNNYTYNITIVCIRRDFPQMKEPLFKFGVLFARFGEFKYSEV